MTTATPDQTADADRAREQAGLLAAMARGDKSALARLYDLLSGPLYSLAFRVTNNSADAQDIVQDVFLQMWRKASAYDTGRGTVFGWATTLTRNRAIDRVRMRKRRTEILAASGPELQPAPLAGEGDSAAALWVQEKAGAVRAALAQLAPDQKSAIELAFFSGLTQAEIAAQSREPLGTIKARIRRGLLKLRDHSPCPAPMITAQQEELATLHALGLLDGAEKLAFEAELTGNAELRGLAASLAETSAAIALAPPQVAPPDHLKHRLLSAIDDHNSEGKVLNFPLLNLAPWALVATLAIAATWLGTQYITLRKENANLRSERQLAEVAYKISQNQLAERSLLAESMINDLGNKLRRNEDLARLKVTALASLAGNTKEAQVIAVWDPEKQTGLLTMEKLPAIADTQDYQIWIVDPAYKNPVNGGIFHVSADGKVALAFKPDQPVAQATAFAISLEKKGGVPKAEGPIVLLGK